jgi:hypothetical protein
MVEEAQLHININNKTTLLHLVNKLLHQVEYHRNKLLQQECHVLNHKHSTHHKRTVFLYKFLFREPPVIELLTLDNIRSYLLHAWANDGVKSYHSIMFFGYKKSIELCQRLQPILMDDNVGDITLTDTEYGYVYLLDKFFNDTEVNQGE